MATKNIPVFLFGQSPTSHTSMWSVGSGTSAGAASSTKAFLDNKAFTHPQIPGAPAVSGLSGVFVMQPVDL